MENQYLNQLEDTNLYDEPSDDDLKRIEDELSDFLDLFQNGFQPFCVKKSPLISKRALHIY